MIDDDDRLPNLDDLGFILDKMQRIQQELASLQGDGNLHSSLMIAMMGVQAQISVALQIIEVMVDKAQPEEN